MTGNYQAIPVKRTPLHDRAQAAGAQFANVAGWEVAASYPGAGYAPHFNVALADLSHFGKIMVQGQSADAIIPSLGVEAPQEIGRGIRQGGIAVYRLRADQFFVNTAPERESDTPATLDSAAVVGRDLVTVTDVTHGRAQLLVLGPASRELLSRLCGLDFHPSRFPDAWAKQSSLAKTTQLIIRHDLNDDSGVTPAYFIIGARSSAAYLWDVILESGSDLDLMTLGWADLESRITHK